MYCPSDVNTGFIQLVGPIQQTDLNSITVKSYPLSISFAPRTTIPSLIGNRIDESTENTCTYKGTRFSLVDVQICQVTNKGYTLPGQTSPPVAELILSFSANTAATDLTTLSGILLCVPIFDSGNQSHSDYLNQLINPSTPACNYTNEVGAEYSGPDYQQIPNSSLTSCVQSCCGDTNCLAYTFNLGTCHLKNTIPSISKNGNTSYVSGTINRNTTQTKSTSCPVPNCRIPNCKGQHSNNGSKSQSSSTASVPTLESIFYEWEGDTSQTSFAYKTCFESINNDNPTSRSLYIVVFPNGIHITQAGYQQLLLQLNGTLQLYMVPPAIRGGESTLRSYKYNDDGNKVATITSQDGIIYATPLSSCTDEFKNRFEYFTLPPRLPTNVSGSFNSKSSYYKTTQYKCVPFNQLKDLSGQYVIPGNKTLDTILYEQQQEKEKEKEQDISGGSGNGKGISSLISTEEIETIIASVAGIAVAAIIALKVGSWISNHA